MSSFHQFMTFGNVKASSIGIAVLMYVPDYGLTEY